MAKMANKQPTTKQVNKKQEEKRLALGSVGRRGCCWLLVGVGAWGSRGWGENRKQGRRVHISVSTSKFEVSAFSPLSLRCFVFWFVASFFLVASTSTPPPLGISLSLRWVTQSPFLRCTTCKRAHRTEIMNSSFLTAPGLTSSRNGQKIVAPNNNGSEISSPLVDHDHRQAFFQFSRTPSPYPLLSPIPSPGGVGRKQHSLAAAAPQLSTVDTAIRNCRHCGYSYRTSSNKDVANEGFCCKECRVCAQWFSVKPSSSSSLASNNDLTLRQPKPTSPRPVASGGGGGGGGGGVGGGNQRPVSRPLSTGNLVVLMAAAPSPAPVQMPPVALMAAVTERDKEQKEAVPLTLLVGARSATVAVEDDSPSPPPAAAATLYVARPPECRAGTKRPTGRPHALNPLRASCSADLDAANLNPGDETWRERHSEKLVRSPPPQPLSEQPSGSSNKDVNLTARYEDNCHDKAVTNDAGADAVNEESAVGVGGADEPARPRPRQALLSLASAAMDWLFAPSEVAEIPREPKRPHQLHTYY